MTLTLVYDGGCPFCRHFALRSELVGGVPELEIRDGRSEQLLRAQLKARGDRKSTRLNSSHSQQSRMPSSA